MTRKPANSLRGILTIGTMLPNALLILAAAFLFIISYIKRSGSYDVYLHDTYYIISRQFALQIIALYLALTWIFYATLNKFFTMRLLSWSHIVLTIITISILLIETEFIRNKASTQVENESQLIEFRSIMRIEGKLVLFSLLTLFLAQLLFLLNPILYVFTKKG